MDQVERWPLLKDDEGLLEAIQATLTGRVQGHPYSSDGTFAENLSSLPQGLRAMAATHWLDIGLTLDSITWHFGNFGEPALVAQTEDGLRELGLDELAHVFDEAKTLDDAFRRSDESRASAKRTRWQQSNRNQLSIHLEPFYE